MAGSRDGVPDGADRRKISETDARGSEKTVPARAQFARAPSVLRRQRVRLGADGQRNGPRKQSDYAEDRSRNALSIRSVPPLSALIALRIARGMGETRRKFAARKSSVGPAGLFQGKLLHGLESALYQRDRLSRLPERIFDEKISFARQVMAVAEKRRVDRPTAPRPTAKAIFSVTA